MRTCACGNPTATHDRHGKKLTRSAAALRQTCENIRCAVKLRILTQNNADKRPPICTKAILKFLYGEG